MNEAAKRVNNLIHRIQHKVPHTIYPMPEFASHSAASNVTPALFNSAQRCYSTTNVAHKFINNATIRQCNTNAISHIATRMSNRRYYCFWTPCVCSCCCSEARSRELYWCSYIRTRYKNTSLARFTRTIHSCQTAGQSVNRNDVTIRQSQPSIDESISIFSQRK